jgi:hypothetical protein
MFVNLVPNPATKRRRRAQARAAEPPRCAESMSCVMLARLWPAGAGQLEREKER